MEYKIHHSFCIYCGKRVNSFVRYDRNRSTQDRNFFMGSVRWQKEREREEREKDTTRRQTKRHPDGWLKAAFEFAESIKFRTLNTTSIEVESSRYANLRTDPSGSGGSLPFA